MNDIYKQNGSRSGPTKRGAWSTIHIIWYRGSFVAENWLDCMRWVQFWGFYKLTKTYCRARIPQLKLSFLQLYIDIAWTNLLLSSHLCEPSDRTLGVVIIDIALHLQTLIVSHTMYTKSCIHSLRTGIDLEREEKCVYYHYLHLTLWFITKLRMHLLYSVL